MTDSELSDVLNTRKKIKTSFQKYVYVCCEDSWSSEKHSP